MAKAKTVTTIPATVNRFNSSPITQVKKRRVAGYARVSTDTDEQFTSYEAQVDYYTNYIKSREDWEFVSVFTDEGISGTSTKHREGFRKMIEEAMAGKIDLIITKSVSRFARNTVDSLSTIRKLKEIGCECYFEKENIWTFDGKGELLLTIMSSLAQEESRSISENVKWGHRKRFADGKVSVPFGRFLGYKRGEDGNLVIDEDEAVTVRKIYRLFLSGLTPHAVAKRLTSEGIPTPGGKDKWNPSTIKSILTNEKYKGDALLQKEFTVDYLTKKKKTNEGEVPQYYVENNHEPIISPEVFEMVQQEFERRKDGSSRYSGVDIFSSKIKCGCCGSYFGSKVWHSTDKYRRIIWQCNRKFDGQKCTTPHLTEDEIKAAFIKAVNKLLKNKNELISNIELIRKTLCDVSALEEQQKSKHTEIAVLIEEMNDCIATNARIAQNQEEYRKRYDSIVCRYESAKAEYEKVEKQISDNLARSEIMSAFIKTLKKQGGVVNEFDDALWGGLLDYLTVYKKDDIRFTFKDGTEIKA